MKAITAIENSLQIMNKYNKILEKNISAHNKYVNKIKEGQQVFDKIKKTSEMLSSEPNKSSGKLKELMKKPMGNMTDKFKKKIGESRKKGKFSIPSPIKKTTEMLKKFGETPIGKNIKLGITKNKKFSSMINDIKTKWNDTWVQMGNKIADSLQPILLKVLALLNSKEFSTMLDLVIKIIEKIVAGICRLLDYLTPLMNIINEILGVVLENSHIVLAVLAAVAIAIGVITAATSIYNAILNIRIIKEKIMKAIQEANPTMIVIKAIIILITALITLIATMEPVRKAVANLTRGFFDFVEGGINSFIDGLASAIEGIITFSGKGINTFLNIFVNPFIDGINLIISGLNLLGANINNIDHLKVDFDGVAKNTGDFIRKGKVDLSGVRESVAGTIENFSAESLKKKIGLDKLQSDQSNVVGKGKDVPVAVNKINDNVNIADEDVKLMRDVAEREMIQNFVTLTPTVSMDNMTVNENADADKLLGKITEALITEVSNSAQGVYA
ncbi:MAG: hypothetical protein N4A63_04745 [Vallitalea sp.]|jgi:hypothetical protein|nr:hypothetical protein [Vallitalea sp.]